MRDLALATLASGTALIAVYAAGLVFVAQHVADRYTPLLYPVVFLRVGLLWLALLSIIILGSLATAMIKVSFWANVSDAVMLIAAVIFTILGLYRIFQRTADRRKILAMVTRLSPSNRITALRDLTWNSVSRGDVTSTEFLLNFSPYGSEDRATLLDWTTQYAPLLEQPWLRQAVLHSFTSGDFDEKAAKLMEPALNRLFLSCLDREWYDSVHEIIIATIRAVGLTSKFTQYHRYAIFDLGFNLHYVGEEGSATERVSQRAPDSLQDARSLFLSQITSIRNSVINDNDPESVTQFCTLLQRLAESGIGLMYVSSQVWEILEDGYGHGLTDPTALEVLADTIGICRHNANEISVFEDGNEHLDRISAHLALYIVKLGRRSELQRMMGNAWFGHPKQLPSRLVMTNGFDEEIYTAVAKELGYKSWPNSARNRGRDFFRPRSRGRRPLRGR
jgi:hypothetical protein